MAKRTGRITGKYAKYVPENSEPIDNGCQGKCRDATARLAEACNGDAVCLDKLKQKARRAVQSLQDAANRSSGTAD